MHQTIAYLLLVLGVIGGSFVAVLDVYAVNWWPFFAFALIGLIGVIMHRRAIHRQVSHGDHVHGNLTTLERSLENIVANLETMVAGKADLPPYEARFEIDRHFRHDLTNFAEARESMIHAFGMQNYADVMSGFAAGERYINRVWSASADGYVDEVNRYLDRALAQFREAREHFAQLQQARRSPSPA